MALFTTGFELADCATLDFCEWTGTGGAPAIVANPVHHGTYAAEFDANGEYAYKTLTSADHWFARIYYRMTVLPPNDGDYLSIMDFRDTGGAYPISLYVYKTGGSLYLRVYDARIGATNYAFAWAINTWYCIELEYYVNAAGKYEVWIDDVSVGSDAGDTSGNNLQHLYVGSRVSAYAVACYVDCVVVDTSYIGPEAVGGLSIPVAMHHYGHHISKIIRG